MSEIKKTILESVKLNESNEIAKNVKTYLHTFKGIRSAILASSADGVIKSSSILSVLRATKTGKFNKSVPEKKQVQNVFSIVQSIAPFSYKFVNTEEETTTTKKYSEKNVLNACHLYLLIDTTDNVTIELLKRENIEDAKKRVATSVKTAKTRLAGAKSLLADMKPDTDGHKEQSDIVSKLTASLEDKELFYETVKNN